MSELNKRIMQLLKELEADLEEQGWDQPASLYIIEAVDDDPYFIKVAEFYAHPCEVLDSLPPLNNGMARGIVLAYEGWTIEVAIDMVKKAYAILEEMGVPRDRQDDIVNVSVGRLLPVAPSEHQDRVECRFVQAMMRDSTSLAIFRKRGQEAHETSEQAHGRLDTSLRRVICIEAME